MRAAGAYSDQIYEATGFFMGPDGQWRFEISDADAKFKAGALKHVALGVAKWHDGDLAGLLDHPKLYAAYPFLKNIPISVEINPVATMDGVWDDGRIEVRATTAKEARSVILHEIAHAIQDKEDFASGGNPSMGELYEGEEVEFLMLQARKLLKEWEEVDAKYNAAEDGSERKNLEPKLHDLTVKMHKVNELLVRAAREEYYRRLAGEVEARNVQTRDELERKARETGDDGYKGLPGNIDAPWWTQDVPTSKVIVVRTSKLRGGYKALSTGLDDATGRPLWQGTEKHARGSIQFPSAGVGNGETVIRMFETANLSTLSHESGHYFLAIMQDLAAHGEAQASEGLQAIREWWRANAGDVAKDAARSAEGVAVSADDVAAWLNNGTTGDAVKDRAIVVGGHEQFARGFEAYLMEGRAPNAEL
jgi:hypothetical protein